MKLRIYLKQSLQMLRETPLISSISIIGTAISIAMIMVVVLVFQVQFADYTPENNRSRMLFVHMTQAKKPNGGEFNGYMSDEVVKECFYSLKIPQAVTAFTTVSKPLSIPGRPMFKAYNIKLTDQGFWQVFCFRFLDGQPFTEADFRSAIPRVVVSDKVARSLYGTTAVVGKTVLIDDQPYTVCGVVSEVSRAAESAYADVWIPYTSDPVSAYVRQWENIIGVFQVDILAKDTDDFDAIRQELKATVARYNATKQENLVSFFHYPIDRLGMAIGSGYQQKVELKDFLAGTGSLLLFLLLVPALNLLGVTQSSVQKRRAEMGVRKAFGATSGMLIRQLLIENCVTTLLGGFIGLCLSFVLLQLGKGFLFRWEETELFGDMLFKPSVFIGAVLFSLLLNLLSAAIPAWRIVRQEICLSLKDAEAAH